MKKIILLLSLCSLLLQGCASAPDINKAAQEGNVNRIRSLLESGESPDTVDRWGRTPLYGASSRDYPEVVSLLLERGADPNWLDYRGKTPAHYTCDPAILELLLDNGADSIAKDTKGITVLHDALRCAEDTVDLERLLLQAGADPNEKDAIGLTPLHIAAGYAGPEATQLLIEHGADVNAQNVQGLTARDMACVMGRDDVVEILDSHGGESKKYFSKDETTAQYERGVYHGNSGVFSLKKGFETNSGFTAIKFTMGWNGEEGSLGMGFTYRGFVTVFGRFFAEPGHHYIIDAFGETHPHKAYAVAKDKETGQVVGIF